MGRMHLLSSIVNPATGQVEGYCIIKSVALKSNIKGSDYLDLVLYDAGGEINAKLWDYNAEQHGRYEPDSIIKVRASVNLWKETEQLKIDRIRNLKEDEEVDMDGLIPCAPRDPAQMYDTLYKRAEGFEDGDLRMLTQYLLREHKEDLLRWPAALKLHHAMRGGLLYHTHTMLRAAEALCDIYAPLYPALSRELVYAGVILHDIAKVPELRVGALGLATAYSVPGQLLGHISMGVSMIERAAAELMIDDGIKQLAQHILLSHHGQAEFGSPKPPMFPEAELVAQIDLLDSRMFEMFDALEPVQVGEFSERQWALDNRQLYKHGHA
ncbi:MAG: HD domain-containing protein [Christensenellaceae bacterium]|jgi:3'-5' exoribonuclease|nr:HD domain-containing protein [Christensenellaceae bacterium]